MEKRKPNFTGKISSMQLQELPEDQAFRAEVREFVAAHLPAEIRDRVLNFQRVEREDYVRWQKILHARGWGAPGWPKEHGGAGWNATQRTIFDEECFHGGAPRQMPFGLSMVGPVIIAFGIGATAGALPAAASCRWTTGGARVIPSPAPVPTLRRSRPAPAPRRSLHRRWPEDLDQFCALGELDFLPGAHVHAGQAAAGHLISVDRHEDARRQGEADPDAGPGLRRQRGVPGQRRGAGRQSAWAKRTRAGRLRNTCSGTSAPTSPASACASACCAG